MLFFEDNENFLGFEGFVKTTLETPLCDTLSSVIFSFEFSTRGFQELKKGPKP
jgi:hypothetical protein